MMLNITKEFIIWSVIFMFLAVVIIKVITMTIEGIVQKTKNTDDDTLMDSIKAWYGLFPVLAGAILAFTFLPAKWDYKILIMYCTYFIGGVLLIYKYLFKVVLDTITKAIQKKGEDL